MPNENMTISEFVNTCNQRIEKHIETCLSSACDTDELIHNSRGLVRKIVLPLFDEVVGDVPFTYFVVPSDTGNHIEIRVGKYGERLLPFTQETVGGILPLYFTVKKKRTQGRNLPAYIGAAWFDDEETHNEDVALRDYILSATNEIFEKQLFRDFERLLNYAEAVVHFREHGFTSPAELNRCFENLGSELDAPPICLDVPQKYEDCLRKDCDILPSYASVPYVMAEEVSARLIDDFAKTDMFSRLSGYMKSRALALRQKLNDTCRLSMYIGLNMKSGNRTLNFIKGLRTLDSSEHADYEDLYKKAAFLTITKPHFSSGLSEADGVSEETVRAITEPGTWYAFDYDTGDITDGSFSTGADIPALDGKHLILVVVGDIEKDAASWSKE